jgi:hypothetical protein
MADCDGVTERTMHRDGNALYAWEDAVLRMEADEADVLSGKKGDTYWWRERTDEGYRLLSYTECPDGHGPDNPVPPVRVRDLRAERAGY